MRLMFKNAWTGFALLMVGVILTGCGSLSPASNPAPAANPDPQANIATSQADDPLRVGDKVRIELTGTEKPIYPMDRTIKDDGTIDVIHIGSVKAAGKTPREIEADIHKQLVPDYYRAITVSVVPQERYYYVGGEVGKADKQPYPGAMTVSRAIQTAQDFTVFADRKKIQITRVNGKVEFVNFNDILRDPKKDLPIYPGDTIFVGRRW